MPRPTDSDAVAVGVRPPRYRFPLMADELVLAFDFGTRRTGVAIANTLTRRARPLPTIHADAAQARWNAVRALIAEWEPDRFVVGIPCHPDGTAHEMTQRCQRFARQLEGRFGRPVARVDERYSSAVAGPSPDLDAAAAVVILQQWLDEGGADA
jgi:putative Holliday junction resolvase